MAGSHTLQINSSRRKNLTEKEMPGNIRSNLRLNATLGEARRQSAGFLFPNEPPPALLADPFSLLLVNFSSLSFQRRSTKRGKKKRRTGTFLQPSPNAKDSGGFRCEMALSNLNTLTLSTRRPHSLPSNYSRTYGSHKSLHADLNPPSTSLLDPICALHRRGTL